MSFLLYPILLCFGLGSALGSSDFSCKDVNSQICLPSGYDKTQPPSSTRNISIFFDIHEVLFNPHEMELDLSMEIKWRDERIYNVVPGESILDIHILDHIWIPTISSLSEKYMRIQEGTDFLGLSKEQQKVTFVRRFKYKIRCYMNFNDFPFDKHECSFRVGSFVEPTEYFTTDAVINNSPWHEALIEVRALEGWEKTHSLLDGDYSVAGFVVSYERNLKKYIVFYYLPCAFLSLGIWLMILWGNTYEERFLFLVLVAAILLYILDAASKIVPCSTWDFNLLQIWIMIHVSFVTASFLELKIAHWWYLKSFNTRLLDYKPIKSKIDLVYFFLYFILYSSIVGAYIAYCELT